MKYLLKTSYPCLIKTMNDFCELEESDTLELQDEKVVFVYPQTDNIVPFYINLVAPKENDKFSIVSQNQEKIILLERQKKIECFQREKLTFGPNSCTIEVSNNQISFQTPAKKLSLECPHSCKNAKIFKVKNYALLQFEHDLYAYSMSTHKLVHFSGDELEIEGNNLKITKNFHDSLSREKCAIYEFDDDIKVISESYVNNKSSVAELVPFRLMESVKARDFSYAFECLSPSLQNKIEQSQIKDFFGNFYSFLPLSTTEFITLSDNDKNYVKFELFNGKIADISIDKL